MQGDDPHYVRCAATLKHFYANNTEVGRAWKNAAIDPRNRCELYLEPFRRCVQGAGALGVMTAYNRINGQVGILNGEVQRILKDQYGLTHAVGDGGAQFQRAGNGGVTGLTAIQRFLEGIPHHLGRIKIWFAGGKADYVDAFGTQGLGFGVNTQSGGRGNRAAALGNLGRHGGVPPV
jgi:hypothetical protein